MSTIVNSFLVLCLLTLLSSYGYGENQDQEQLELRYTGTDHTANTNYHDGQMRPAIGTQNYQILRANRAYPERIEFRTGPYRLDRKITEYKIGDKTKAGWDEPGAGIRAEEARYYIWNFSMN